MRLLEREAQLAALSEYARDAAGGQGRLVLVSGEAGVGKSSLVEVLQSRTPEAQWFWGACDGFSTPASGCATWVSAPYPRAPARPPAPTRPV